MDVRVLIGICLIIFISGCLTSSEHGDVTYSRCPVITIQDSAFVAGEDADESGTGKGGQYYLKTLNTDRKIGETGLNLTFLYPDGVNITTSVGDLNPGAVREIVLENIRPDSNTTAPKRVHIVSNECPETSVLSVVIVKNKLGCPDLYVGGGEYIYNLTTGNLTITIRNQDEKSPATGIRLKTFYFTSSSKEFDIPDIEPSSRRTHSISAVSDGQSPDTVQLISNECPEDKVTVNIGQHDIVP